VSIPQWIAGNGLGVVAVDGLCVDSCTIDEIAASCEVVDDPDMLDALWTDRPQIPMTPVETLDVESFGGTPRADKISWLRKWMLLNDVDQVLLTSLDEVAWMLNVRANDIEYNPLVISYLLISQDYVKWFVRGAEQAEDLDTLDSFDELKADDVEIYDYSQVLEALSECSGAEGGSVIFVDPSTLNHHVSAHLKSVFAEDCIRYGKSPVILQKAIKVESEIENLRQTHIDDGVAMTRFLYWLENEVASGREVTEWEASEMLTSLRAETPGYKGNSFENISAYGAGAALPHYSTPKEGSAVIQPRGLYLVDSGGQYLTGTTDITRTIPMGECTYLEKEDYTLVLKGMIDLSMAVFPHGTTGHQLDAFARMPLWRAHRNFGHGTGHGVGFYLCVHEGPQSIRFQPNPQPLLPGMLTSNEPAIYREGMHGVRHENIVLCKEAGESEFGKWLEFETMTLCHIDTSAVLPELLGPEALAWLNEYNKRVYETLSEHLAPEIAQWLYAKCNS
jgi:Xaa-Pro aminopeptidase